MKGRVEIGASLFLFAMFAAYGLQALTIPLFPGQEHEPFKPRTMPVLLAVAGLVLVAIHLWQHLARRTASAAEGVAGFAWLPAVCLCGVMLAYGFLMTPAGFVPATSLFLAAGFAILGERRWGVLVIVPILFSMAFYLLMTRGLGLYLAAGSWWGA